MAQEEKFEIPKDSMYDWMVRPCQVYEEELRDCRSFKARFHQYFIYGEMLDCSQWKEDASNCNKWTDGEDVTAKNTLIESEKARKHARLKAHYANDIWKRRDSPPVDWNKPLPQWMVDRDADTYLSIKAKKLRGEEVPADLKDYKICSIM